MKTEKKLLISEDLAGAEREIHRLENYIPILNKLPEVFDQLDLGVVNEEISLALITDGGASAIKMFENAIIANCMAIKQVNKHFINAQLEIQKPTIESFKSEVESILNEAEKYFSAGSNFSYSEEDRTYFLSDKSKDKIIEAYKIYLTDENEIRLFNEFQKTFEALQSLDLSLTKHTRHSNDFGLMRYFERKNNFGNTERNFDKKSVLELFKKKVVF